MKSILLKASMMLLIIGSIAACSSSNNKESEKTGKEYTSAYICPMHCKGSGSDSTGTCPTCGMDYIKNDQDNK